jgi:hypothetical protein
MSRKHNHRTRAEILAKREQPIAEVRVQRQVPTPQGPIWVPQPTHIERLRAAFDASKYTPHIGAKEQERAKRCYMVSAFIGGPERSAPVMHQFSKATHEDYLEAREQEYESVF